MKPQLEKPTERRMELVEQQTEPVELAEQQKEPA